MQAVNRRLYLLLPPPCSGCRQNEKELNDNVPNIMEKVCLGELLQSVTIATFTLRAGYLRIISGKTAALFEGASMRARTCALPDTDVKCYAAFGWHLA
jgi:geranylgeranyl pyrophosphate synthase